tara:strand:+ start:243 stop:509 length:267 start_codon:yes stop_codon:yes gene_type:complete
VKSPLSPHERIFERGQKARVVKTDNDYDANMRYDWLEDGMDCDVLGNAIDQFPDSGVVDYGLYHVRVVKKCGGAMQLYLQNWQMEAVQ